MKHPLAPAALSYSKVIPVLEWFASCRIITKHSAADAYELEAEQLKDDGYRHMITSMLRGADFGIQSLQMRDLEPATSQQGDIFTYIPSWQNIWSHSLTVWNSIQMGHS